MVQFHIYQIGTYQKNMTNAQRQHLLSLLCVSRREKVEKIKIAASYDAHLIASWLLEKELKAALGQRTKAEDFALHFSYQDNGKPYLADHPKLCFNLSHSGSYVAIAIANSMVGVDIEVNAKREQAIARRFFHSRERSYLFEQGMTEEQRKTEFQKIWTMKEAYLKYTGEGLRKSLPSFWVDPVTGQIEDEPEICCHLKKVDKGVAALCCQKEQEVNYQIITL